MDDQVYNIALEGIKSLYLLLVPLVVAVSLVGALVAFFQTAITVHDTALNYAARLLITVAVLYFMWPSFSRSLVALAEMALQ